jgi:uncharacterized protein (TIGR02271 family)
MKQPVNLREGMIVHSVDGAKLGKVVSCRSDGFIIEKGMFLPKATLFQYDDIAEMRGDDVYLAHERAQLSDASWWNKREQAHASRMSRVSEETKRTAEEAKSTISEKAAGPHAGPADLTSRGQADISGKALEEIRMPLAEEEVSAEKHTRDIGEVRVHKRVVVKQKQITIPVMHEEVRIERVPVDATTARPSTEGTFVESTVAIPLHDEEVEIHKRAVVREEVRVTKQTFQEEKTATTEVRREEVDIEEPKASKGYLHPPTP